MKKLIVSVALMAVASTPFVTAQASSPVEDRTALVDFYKKHIPNADVDDFINGVYAIDPAQREQWEEIEEFAPYEIAIDQGREIFETPFKNGKTFASCFGDDLSKVRAKYPYHDEKMDTIVTLEGDINKCRADNGEKPFKWKKGKIAQVSAYIAYEGRGEKVNVKVDTAKAKAWYDKGKNFFYAKRGQLNMACADCHVYNSNRWIRGDLLSPAVGHTTHFPVHRSKWGEIGTLHRRYGGCNKQVRAKDFKAQGDEYKALEFFHAAMSNGMELNGPGARR